MYVPHVCFVMHTCKKHATVHTEKWQDMELPFVQSTLNVREFSKNQSFTYMIKIYVLKSENGKLKMSVMYCILPAHHFILLPKVAISIAL